MEIIDSHSHIHSQKDFPDVDAVIRRAEAAGVKRQIIIGCDYNDSLAAMNLAQRLENLSYVIGTHPHEAREVDENLIRKYENIIKGVDEFEKVSLRPVAIGEIGLDYFKNISPKNIQLDAFKRQIDLAMRFNLPIVLHVRDAFEDTVKILDQFKPQKAVFHCFSGGIAEMKWARERRYAVSFSGVVTYPKAIELQAAAKAVDDSGYFVETDCPYLAPQKYRGQQNEPAFVVETAKFIADLRGQNIEIVAENTTKNVVDFFGLEIL